MNKLLTEKTWETYLAQLYNTLGHALSSINTYQANSKAFEKSAGSEGRKVKKHTTDAIKSIMDAQLLIANNMPEA